MKASKSEMAKPVDNEVLIRLPPGHNAVFHPGTEILIFSPNEQLQETMEVVAKNIEAME